MAASNDDVIYELDVWDILAGRVVRRLEGVPKGRVSCAVSKDSRMVAARSHDGTIRLWELASGGPRLTMKEREKLPHADPWGKPLAFSPNGRTIATIINGKPGVDLWDLPSGKQFGSLLGHDLAVTAITFTPDGRRLLTGSEDTTILGWDLTRPARGLRSLSSNLTEKDLATHWGRLRSGSAEEAYRSEWALVGDPRKTVDFLAKQIRPSPTIRPEQVRSWIADLDSDQYEVRERAQGELQRHFDQTEAMLRKAVAGNVSAEVRSRINRIIDASFPAIPEPDQLRELRAIEVLEQIGTTEARDLLRRLAKSDVPTAISRDAAQSLKRLEKCSQ